MSTALGSNAMPPYQDPHGRCECINSDFAKGNTLGPNLAVCFDGNCHPNGTAYFTDSFRQVQMDVGSSCLDQCGGLSQICIAVDNPCTQNASQIDTTCGAGTADPSVNDNTSDTATSGTTDITDGTTDITDGTTDITDGTIDGIIDDITAGTTDGTDDGDEPDNRGYSIWWIALVAALIALVTGIIHWRHTNYHGHQFR